MYGYRPFQRECRDPTCQGRINYGNCDQCEALTVKAILGAVLVFKTDVKGVQLHLSQLVIDLIENLLQVNPHNRISLEEVLRHAWML